MKCWRADTFRRKRGKNCKSNALCFFLPGLWCYLQLSKFSCMHLPDSKWLFYFFLFSTDFTLFEGWLTEGCVWSCCFSFSKRSWYGQSPTGTAWMMLPWPGMDLDGLNWLSDQEPRGLIEEGKELKCLCACLLAHGDVATLRLLHVSQWVSFNLVCGQSNPSKPMLLFLSEKTPIPLPPLTTIFQII